MLINHISDHLLTQTCSSVCILVEFKMIDVKPLLKAARIVCMYATAFQCIKFYPLAH